MWVQAPLRKRRSRGSLGSSMLLPRAAQVSLQGTRLRWVHPAPESPGRVSLSASISSPVVTQETSDQHHPRCVTKHLSIVTHHLLHHCRSKDICKAHFPPLWTCLSTAPPSLLHPRQTSASTARTHRGLYLVDPSSLIPIGTSTHAFNQPAMSATSRLSLHVEQALCSFPCAGPCARARAPNQSTYAPFYPSRNHLHESVSLLVPWAVPSLCQPPIPLSSPVPISHQPSGLALLLHCF